MSYALSLMRSHNYEHCDTLPVIDIMALKHVAYVFDALIYYIRSGTDMDNDVIRDGISVHSWQDHDENENEEQDDDVANQNSAMETDSIDGDSEMGSKTGRKHSFFQRSESTLCLGCPPPDPFETPLTEALPLADQPHLLQPNCRREDLFGVPKRPLNHPSGDPSGLPPGPFDRIPTHMALSARTVETTHNQPGLGPPYGSVAMEMPTCTLSTAGAPNTADAPSTSGTSVIVSRPGTGSEHAQSSDQPTKSDSVNTSTDGKAEKSSDDGKII